MTIEEAGWPQQPVLIGWVSRIRENTRNFIVSANANPQHARLRALLGSE